MAIVSSIYEFANSLTGWFLRTPIINGIRTAMIKPIDDVLQQFDAFRTGERWLLDHNSQIVYLEHYLNDMFGIGYDVATRDADIFSGDIIWIESGNKSFLYLYNKIESRPKRYLFNKSESGDQTFLNNFSEILSSNHFIVWIPVAVSYDDATVRSKIDFFKLAGKTYSIQTY